MDVRICVLIAGNLQKVRQMVMFRSILYHCILCMAHANASKGQSDGIHCNISYNLNQYWDHHYALLYLFHDNEYTPSWLVLW